MEFEELQMKYEAIQKEHNLPTFEELNSVFDIGKIEHDSGNLLRDVRRMMSEKITHYLRLMELVLNPAQGSPLFLILLKEITLTDRQLLDKVFPAFIDLELTSYKLEIAGSSDEEAEFISRIYRVWMENQKQLLAVIGILERNWKQVASKNIRSRDYFN